MNLTQFIRELECIKDGLHNPNQVEVRMADYIPVVKPVYKDNAVFITDIETER